MIMITAYKYLITITVIGIVFQAPLYANGKIQSYTKMENDTLRITLFNSGEDTLYLFNSYIELSPKHDCGKEPLWESEYLHRYDKKGKIYKLSFLPIIPYLSVRFNDLITLGKQRILKKWAILYSFKPIAPEKSVVISIPRKALVYDAYTKDINLKDYGKNDNICFKEATVKAPFSITIELAIYKNIDLLINQDAYYFREGEFDAQAKDYIVLSIPFNISSLYSSL